MGSSCSEDLAGELSCFRLSPSLFGELGGTHPLLAGLGKSALPGLGQWVDPYRFFNVESQTNSYDE